MVGSRYNKNGPTLLRLVIILAVEGFLSTYQLPYVVAVVLQDTHRGSAITPTVVIIYSRISQNVASRSQDIS